jgi:hypothetical protein
MKKFQIGIFTSIIFLNISLAISPQHSLVLLFLSITEFFQFQFFTSSIFFTCCNILFIAIAIDSPLKESLEAARATELKDEIEAARAAYPPESKAAALAAALAAQEATLEAALEAALATAIAASNS